MAMIMMIFRSTTTIAKRCDSDNDNDGVDVHGATGGHGGARVLYRPSRDGWIYEQDVYVYVYAPRAELE